MKYNATSIIDHVDSQLCENVSKSFKLLKNLAKLLRPVINHME